MSASISRHQTDYLLRISALAAQPAICNSHQKPFANTLPTF